MAARKAKTGVTQDPRRGTFRIIGGEWRRRRLDFVTSVDVRPSPDRVRETLFNWLMPMIEGSRCLDLFAGSGALGIEALSRGAAHVHFVDREPVVVAKIREHLAALGAGSRAEVVLSDAMSFLRDRAGNFDVVFVDPPFRQGIVPAVLQALPARLKSGSLVYLEHEKKLCLDLGHEWRQLKESDTTQVAYSLATYEPSTHNPSP